ncbi:lycopene cyclase domain-containing protein [Corynebacterium sp. A21]|uniref:lycopene cyclase domain-containing protein n=1 Tax=Corynebacterium sp. A21 TaxID=3457318 RepID=UPI003FD201ED
METFLPFAYLSILLITITCMALCDWRWRLAFFLDARRAAILSVLMVAAFLVWDALGIISGSFFRGGSEYMTGVVLAPEMPVEEPLFLFFLTYLTINLTSGVRMLLKAADEGKGQTV